MASEKPKNRDRIPASNSLQQMNEELGFGSINNEAAYSTGIPDTFPNLNMLLPSPHLQFVDAHGIPGSYYQELPLPDINLMSDVSQFNSSQISEIDHSSLYGSVSDFPHSNGNFIDLCQLPTLSDTVSSNMGMNAASHVNALQRHQIDRNYVTARDNAVGCLQMCRQGGEANARNTHMLQLNGSSICRGGSTPMLGNTQGMISAVQSDYPEKLDGSFLTLGVGGNTVARSNLNVSSRDISQKTERNVHPQLNTSCGKKGDISLLNLDNMAHGFSSFQNNEGEFPSVPQNVGGFSSLAQNVGGYSGLAQNVGGYSGLAQNVGGLTEWPSLSCNDLQVMYSNSTGFNSSSSHVSQTLQVDRHHYNKPNWNLGLGENRNVRFANIDPHKGFQSYQAIASVPLSSSQSGMPDSGEFRVPEWPALSPFMTRKTTQSTCGQLQQHYMGSDGNFSSDPYIVSPFVGNAESNAEQDQSVAGQQFPGYQGSATQTTESGLFPKSIVLPFANQTFPVKQQGCAAQVAKDPMNVGVQPASNLDRPQPIGLVQASKNLLGPAGQVIPVANGSGPSQASNVPVGPSRKRSATQPPPAAPERQRRKARSRIPIRPSIPNLSQTAPPVTPLAQTARPPLARTTLPPMAKNIPPVHIKWQGPDGTPQFSGLKCMLCKRDISYMPDGPFVQPAVPPAVAVLPCGHCFHDHCLQLITPKDQAKNPPCIPCVIGET